MKAETLDTLLVARTLFDQVGGLVAGAEKYLASAALVIVQDALELVLLAVLVERGIDESRSLENLGFNELLSEIKKAGIRIPKTGTLKALNKARVIVKHHGQCAEPSSVLTYVNAATVAVDEVLTQTIGMTLRDVLAHELIRPGESRENIESATKAIDSREYFKALEFIRRALFLEIEQDYVIEDWKDHPANGPINWTAVLGRRGNKAPWHTKNAEWIAENVREPFQYIQLDHERLKLDLIEWGVTTQDFWNLWRLTPPVYRFVNTTDWIVKGEIHHLKQASTSHNARYCLERAISLLARKQAHFDLARWIDRGAQTQIHVRVTRTTKLYVAASVDSKIECEVAEDTILTGNSVVPGFNRTDHFVHVFNHDPSGTNFIVGYLPLADCEISK